MRHDAHGARNSGIRWSRHTILESVHTIDIVDAFCRPSVSEGNRQRPWQLLASEKGMLTCHQPGRVGSALIEMDFDRVAQANETLDIAFEISRILDTGLDRKTVSLLIALCENGVNPEVLCQSSSAAPVCPLPTLAPRRERCVMCADGAPHIAVLQIAIPPPRPKRRFLPTFQHLSLPV